MKRVEPESWVLTYLVPALLTIMLICVMLHYLHRYQSHFGKLNPYPRHASATRSPNPR